MTRRIAVVACLMILSVLGAVSPAGAADARLYTVLTGAAERPGPGDPDAIGRAVITINDETNQLCLILQYANVDGAISGLHIHLAPTTASGPIVVPFANPTQQGSGQFRQCVTVDNEALLDNIAANPAQYYLNLHSAPSFGPGAIRGQLQAI
ncbi:MAG: CHRD domain-containing protein [Acidimicrobiales bacterium]